MNCAQRLSNGGACPNEAVAIWTWVTGEKVAVCSVHKRAADAVAGAMGYASIFSALPASTPLDLKAVAAKLKADAKTKIREAVKATEDSLDFAPPEMRELHLSRLAERCVQIGIDLALALHDAGVPR